MYLMIHIATLCIVPDRTDTRAAEFAPRALIANSLARPSFLAPKLIIIITTTITITITIIITTPSLIHVAT